MACVTLAALLMMAERVPISCCAAGWDVWDESGPRRIKLGSIVDKFLYKIDNKLHKVDKLEAIMVGLRKRGELIRTYIIDNLEAHPQDITKFTAEKFGISRQAINMHIKRLVNQNSVIAAGTTRNRRYKLRPIAEFEKTYPVNSKLEEDAVWRSDIRPLLRNLPDNVIDTWHYGFTEMVNNVIDHSSARVMVVNLSSTAKRTKALIYDDGEGIFRKIQRELGLNDERHAVLELSKGKLTTDPEKHTGEGIFFSSRVFDSFAILSGGVHFSHKFDEIEDWILEHERPRDGTGVFMELSNNTARTTKSVFDQFTSGDDYGFNKTVVPVRLARYGEEKLISRSQAKRLLVRVDRFKVVVFDFSDVETIGQAFADEIFRVFQIQNAQVELVPINTQPAVDDMIRRARQSYLSGQGAGLANQQRDPP